MGDADKGAAVSFLDRFWLKFRRVFNLSVIISRCSRPSVLNVIRSRRAANTKLDPTYMVCSDARPVKLLVSLTPTPINKKVKQTLTYSTSNVWCVPLSFMLSNFLFSIPILWTIKLKLGFCNISILGLQ